MLLPIHLNRKVLLIMLLAIILLLLAAATAVAQAKVPSSTCWRDTICTGREYPSFDTRGQDAIFAPASRTVLPISTLDEDGTLIGDFATTVLANGTLRVFDFGLEVGGIVTIVSYPRIEF